MANPPAPKLDIKMLAMPAMLLLSKKIDFTNEDTVKMAQGALVAVLVLAVTIHFFVYSRVTSRKDGEKKIWVPPKAKPELPFGLGPPKEPIKIEDFTETTYKDHEIQLLKDSIQSILMSVAISMFMSYKFKIHMSVLMQAIMIPMNMFDVIVLKKYVLGMKKIGDGSDKLYGELESAPTAAVIAQLNGTLAPAASTAIAKDEPRVEELPDEPKEKQTTKKIEEKTLAHDID